MDDAVRTSFSTGNTPAAGTLAASTDLDGGDSSNSSPPTPQHDSVHILQPTARSVRRLARHNATTAVQASAVVPTPIRDPGVTMPPSSAIFAPDMVPRSSLSTSADPTVPVTRS